MSAATMAPNMAAAPQVTPATLVTLKVSYHGSTRRFKLPLREMVPAFLENRVSLAVARLDNDDTDGSG